MALTYSYCNHVSCLCLLQFPPLSSACPVLCWPIGWWLLWCPSSCGMSPSSSYCLRLCPLSTLSFSHSSLCFRYLLLSRRTMFSTVFNLRLSCVLLLLTTRICVCYCCSFALVWSARFLHRSLPPSVLHFSASCRRFVFAPRCRVSSPLSTCPHGTG